MPEVRVVGEQYGFWQRLAFGILPFVSLTYSAVDALGPLWGKDRASECSCHGTSFGARRLNAL
ncbi:hypothetical protein PMI06_003121 [Burkholderia sp. BT03]|nr:hypothetical protein PMI06_003121 [Burkholderia sp. BT03]SKC61855.1 hypothetical protein SAMN06266956_1215 [Paraburkholderia hospita]